MAGIAGGEYDFLVQAFVNSSWSGYNVGVLYYLFANKINLNLVICIISLIGIVASFFSPLTNYLLIFFMPYAITFLSLYPKQIKTKTNTLNYSYEIYLIGFPLQQTLVSIFGGQMQIYLNMILSISIISIILVILYLLSRYKKSRNL